MDRKIYNEITIDIATGKILHEDSFMYSGPIALCEGAGDGGSGGDGGAGGAGSGDNKGGQGGGPQVITLGDILPDDMKGDKLPGSLKDFAGVQIPGKDAKDEDVKLFHGKLSSLAKTYADTKSMVGGMIKIPGKDAKPEEITAFREKLGVPKTAEDYKIDKPVFEDKKAMFSDDIFKGFTKGAHAVGYTPEQVQFAINFQADMVRQQIKTMDKEAEEGIKVLRSELGDEYDGLMEGAELVVSKFFPQAARDKIVKHGIGNDPDFSRGMIAIFKATKEAGGLKGLGDGSQGNETVDAVQKEIDTIMASKEYMNNDHATHEKLSALFVKKQKLLGTYRAEVKGNMS
jgi:hypothetical protein